MTNTKIWAGVSLFLFFALVVSVFTAAIIIHSVAPATVISSAVSSTTPAGTNSATTPVGRRPVTSPATKPAIILSAAIVAKHNNAGDCWTIISGQVYNLTSFADLHSGGPQAILGTCGVDSTTAFFNRHSTRELNILAQYLIGSVGQTISAAPAGQATKTTSPAPAPGRFNRENDD